MLIKHDSAQRRVVKDWSIYVMLAHPLFLDDLVHDSTVQDVVEIVLIQVPEAVMTLEVLLRHNHLSFIRVVIDVQYFLKLFIDGLFHDTGGVLRVAMVDLDFVKYSVE